MNSFSPAAATAAGSARLPAGFGRLEDVVFLPPVLPAQFEVGGELGVVAEWWRSVASVRLRLL